MRFFCLEYSLKIKLNIPVIRITEVLWLSLVLLNAVLWKNSLKPFCPIPVKVKYLESFSNVCLCFDLMKHIDLNIGTGRILCLTTSSTLKKSIHTEVWSKLTICFCGKEILTLPTIKPQKCSVCQNGIYYYDFLQWNPPFKHSCI